MSISGASGGKPEYRLADRIQQVAPSATLAISAKAKKMKAEGIDVIGFGAGEPDFDTPAHIKAAAIAALNAGDTKYLARKGAALVDLIARKLKEENGLSYDRAQILVSNGAKHSIYNIIQAVCGPGDEVLIPAPYWVSYPEMVRLAGATPVFLPTDAGSGFKVSPAQLDAATGPRTRLFIFNSPSNPTGAVYEPDEVRALAAVLAKRRLLTISDEIYEHLLYDGAKFLSLAAAHPAMKDLTVTINGHSKTYAMTGWRIGYAAGPEPIISAARKLQDHSTSDPVSFAIAGAAAALEASQEERERMRAEFDVRRRYMVDRFRRMKGVQLATPRGAFYAFPDVSAHYGRKLSGMDVKDSLTFAEACLVGARVAVVPGGPFGADGFVRFSYATDMASIREGLDRFEKWLEGR
ncbi:MAG: pyridoxal phosphate-dependent aminotransferase [Planctomycetota bacterium]|nr:pyridoxal phosphate-dependent aminotransferase [Planctomycetota bacterium]